MGRYQLSNAAVDDLAKLYEYGIINYGLNKADDYYDGLTERLTFLAENPGIGFHVNNLVPGLQQFRYKRHAVFYKSMETDILVVRILGEEMDFEQHISDQKL